MPAVVSSRMRRARPGSQPTSSSRAAGGPRTSGLPPERHSGIREHRIGVPAFLGHVTDDISFPRRNRIKRNTTTARAENVTIHVGDWNLGGSFLKIPGALEAGAGCC